MQQLPYPKSKTQMAIVAATAALALVILLAATGLILLHNRHSGHHTPSISRKVITHSTSKPDEAKPAADYAWAGQPGDPKWISLPTIGTAGYVQQVGVDQNKQVAVPSNVHMAGWFVDTMQPGQKGLSVIDGHVDGHTTGGIFRNLKNLKPGDTYSITLGNGRIITYAVMSVTAIDAGDAVSPLFSQDPEVTSQLNLITCGGTFSATTKTYDKRIIVASKLVTPEANRAAI